MSSLGRGSVLARALEGIALALDSIRANKIRAALTILGIAIGAMVVVAMAAAITGIRNAVEEEVSRTGPTSFMVLREWRSGIVISGDDWEARMRRRPRITNAEVRMIAALPSVEDIRLDLSSTSRVSWQDKQLGAVEVLGNAASWMRVSGGTLLEGRPFTAAEDLTNGFVVMINEEASRNLFPNIDPVGKTIRIFGFPFVVVGTYRDASSLFRTPQPAMVIPRSTFQQVTGQGRRNFFSLAVLPMPGVSQATAMDEVTIALRVSRGLKPGDPNNFDLVSGAEFLESFDNVTKALFLVMLLLSSIGLMVGGLGVIAIMMISVTERTREIGIRKALGATHGEVLFQFLIEAVTLTVIGGLCGMALGAAVAWGIRSFTSVPAIVPLWSIVTAVTASAITGICFGLYPANKAARLDPVESLRYE